MKRMHKKGDEGVGGIPIVAIIIFALLIIVLVIIAMVKGGALGDFMRKLGSAMRGGG